MSARHFERQIRLRHVFPCSSARIRECGSSREAREEVIEDAGPFSRCGIFREGAGGSSLTSPSKCCFRSKRRGTSILCLRRLIFIGISLCVLLSLHLSLNVFPPLVRSPCGTRRRRPGGKGKERSGKVLALLGTGGALGIVIERRQTERGSLNLEQVNYPESNEPFRGRATSAPCRGFEA